MTKIEIEHIQFSVNPVNTKKTTKITLDVTDKEVTYKNDTHYAGEFYSGQQIGVV